MRAVQPIAHEFLSRDAFALRDLRFVMWEDVVDPAAVDIDLVSQQLGGHCAALDVPARTTRAPRGIPFYIAVLFVPRFPQCKIPYVFLIVFIVLHAAG